MENSAELKEYYKSFYDKFESHHLLLKAIKTKGMDLYNQFDFPAKSVEEWKYTSVAPILQNKFNPLNVESAQVDYKEKIKINNLEAEYITFVDGHFSPASSTFSGSWGELIVGNIKDELDKNPEMILPHLADYSKIDNIFNALNTALLNDGAVIKIPDNVVKEKPYVITYISGNNKNVLSLPRNLIVMGKNSSAKIIIRYISLNETEYFTNAVTEIFLNENAKLELYKLNEENTASYHIEKIQVYQEKFSSLKIFNFSFGGAIVRNDINSRLEGKAAEAELYGIYFQNGKQHVDNHTLVEHNVPECLSNEIYKGILADESTGVFNGKIIVKENAQITNAYQTNKTVLLSEKAKMNTKPQLEIFADDVKCSHGATIGRVDDNSLFYLKARGIPEKVARLMLLNAFMEDITEKISINEITEYIHSLIESRLKPAGE